MPALLGLLATGCATRVATQPAPLTMMGKSFADCTLAIMPLGTWDTLQGEAPKQRLKASWFPRTMYGKGEVTTLQDPYEEFGLAVYNRMRGYSIFPRAVIVKNRAEADRMGATHLLVYHIGDCYAVGRGANWNFIEWITYEGVCNVDVTVYDLAMNQRIQYQNIQVKATTTSPWSSPDVRDYIRRGLLRGVTFHNVIAQIAF